ncbi:sensor histidine kinase [Paludibacterium sp. B53371]|uniref:sensor histidine kinase n=1 Tax=Paludibacterium sp. B53371 TaxID=2806263 RepID=UPI001C05BD25|nr:histidine kinase [Paludibacterium sp. B53371]
MRHTTLKSGLRELLAHTLLFCGIGLVLTLAGWLGATDLLALLLSQPGRRWPILLLTLILSLAISGFLIFAHRAAADRANLAVMQQKAATARQAEIASQLAMLQAQIEPHFLFNTLANVQSLIDQDAATAKQMLAHLNDYLRATLTRTRLPQGTLGDELTVIRHLLFIAGIRLGERLQWQMEVDPGLLTHPLPPLLLQPLVENALKHGIEPALLGGRLHIRAGHLGDELVLTVSDNGVGMPPSGHGHGVGLANVRQRLDSLYGAAGRLRLQPNPEGGVCAALHLPWQGDQAGDSPISQA